MGHTVHSTHFNSYIHDIQIFSLTLKHFFFLLNHVMAINLIAQSSLTAIRHEVHTISFIQRRRWDVQDWWEIPICILIAFRFPGKHVGTSVHFVLSHKTWVQGTLLLISSFVRMKFYILYTHYAIGKISLNYHLLSYNVLYY